MNATRTEPPGLASRLQQDMDLDAGRIPAYLFNDPQVYQRELETIFERCWQCVGHASEVPEPGDYVTRYLGPDPVIVVRSEDSQVRVLLNVCRHRGMRICRSDLGNSAHFRCPYHGWTYRNDGQLTGVPYQQLAYGDTLDRTAIQLREARVAEYGGLIFATWDETCLLYTSDAADE